MQALGFLDRDHALVADRLHSTGEEIADLGVAIGRDGPDLGDLGIGRDLARAPLDVRGRRVDGEVDAALQVHRVHARRDRLRPFTDDGLGEHGGRGGAVAGDVAGPGRDLAHHLGAHVLELVLELDVLGDGDAVLGHARRAEGLIEHHVAALGAEGDLDGIRQGVHPTQHLAPGIAGEFYFLGSHILTPVPFKQLSSWMT